MDNNGSAGSGMEATSLVLLYNYVHSIDVEH